MRIPLLWVYLPLHLLFTNSAAAEDLENQEVSEIPAAEELFQQHCNHCHDGTDPRAPARDSILALSPGKIYKSLNEGSMKENAAPLSDEERQLLAEHLSLGNAKLDFIAAETPQVQCDRQEGWFDYTQPVMASGWGISSIGNERLIPASVAGLSRAGVKKLKLKWAFGFPNSTIARAQPALAGGALFMGSQEGTVYALDAESGCLYWTYTADDEVRTAISISNWQGDQDRDPEAAPLLYFGDRKGYVYAVNAVTGEEAWKVRPEIHPAAMITGAPNLYNEVLYVPVSSKEEAMANSPKYKCCTSRGSVVALDANSGEKLWQTYTIPVPFSEQGKNSHDKLLYGPAGAVVYHSPTIDKQRNQLYIGSDNNYTPPDTNSNTIFAISLKDGAIIWKRQMTKGNIFNYACNEVISSEKQLLFNANCPDENLGHNSKLLGFAAPPVVVKSKDGKEVLVAGQKNGLMWGLDPDTGAILWKRNIAAHPENRGVTWGMAAEQGIIFGTISPASYDGSKGGPAGAMEELGIVALDAMTGEILWKARVVDHCSKEYCSGYYSSLTMIPGVLFAGSRDGFLRAFESRSGALLWEFDANVTVTTLNGTTAHGGSFNHDGPVIAHGNVYVPSGNGYFLGGRPGNAFLVFSVEGK